MDANNRVPAFSLQTEKPKFQLDYGQRAEVDTLLAPSSIGADSRNKDAFISASAESKNKKCQKCGCTLRLKCAFCLCKKCCFDDGKNPCRIHNPQMEGFTNGLSIQGFEKKRKKEVLLQEQQAQFQQLSNFSSTGMQQLRQVPSMADSSRGSNAAPGTSANTLPPAVRDLRETLACYQQEAEESRLWRSSLYWQAEVAAVAEHSEAVERYQHNCDLLNELFAGPSDDGQHPTLHLLESELRSVEGWREDMKAFVDKWRPASTSGSLEQDLHIEQDRSALPQENAEVAVPSSSVQIEDEMNRLESRESGSCHPSNFIQDGEGTHAQKVDHIDQLTDCNANLRPDPGGPYTGAAIDENPKKPCFPGHLCTSSPCSTCCEEQNAAPTKPSFTPPSDHITASQHLDLSSSLRVYDVLDNPTKRFCTRISQPSELDLDFILQQTSSSERPLRL